ncbi:MAG: tripartite tricarboxylate transporter permease, partial [Desulfopila sp.]|nr:tripartite tricarboxylate transporter permease [Desulfopila sp.]
MEIFFDSFLNLFAGPALGGVLPLRFLYLILGTIIGLVLGVLPGLGGVVGLALLLPFTFNMDPYMAFALMVAMTSVTTTSDTITSVFFAVPGSVGSSATILDGHPMAKKGEAGRALGAAYMASLLGGLIGALMLFLAVPLLRPILMLFAAPEFLMLAVLGLVVVGSLTGDEPLKGLLAAALGLTMGLVGMERFNGIPRWTFGELYLWDGISVVVVGLGLFAIPEIIDMIIKGKSIADSDTKGARGGVLQGVVDVFRNWFLMLRCGLLGAFLGALPGIGVSLINWLAYGHALQTEKGARDTFGKGDVRGVIAPESSNNAKEGGSLLPTLAFGIPGSPSAAILLGGFIIHGIAPGPNMLTTNLDLTYTMIWALVIANIVGTSLCLWSTNILVKI